MIDWSALVADVAPNLTENEAKGPCSYSPCRNKPAFQENVGTAETRAPSGFDGFCSDVPTVPQDFEGQRTSEHEKYNQTSFKKPGGGGVSGESAPHKSTSISPSCKTCAHVRRPGLSDGLCSARDDLPYAYTPGHPLRRLPDDGGVSCRTWSLHEAMVTRSPQSDERRTS